ncbi:MAG: biopolymer transporter ExbD [Stagnimonas sp.]|nr:biopolymer transporter ExbD [Stagnimonas sp.]
MHGLTRKARTVLRRDRRRKQVGELNLVPMIDILVVLVFFLLVNSTGVSILGLNLPDATKTSQPDVNRQPLVVTVRGNGLVLTEGLNELGRYGSAAEGYDYRSLSERLLTVKNARPDETRITLLVEPATTHDTLVQTMDAVRITPSSDGRTLRDLFPNIALGDAPVQAGPAPAAGGTP